MSVRIPSLNRAAVAARYGFAALGAWGTLAIVVLVNPAGRVMPWAYVPFSGHFTLDVWPVPLGFLIGLAFAGAAVIEQNRQRRFGTPELEAAQPAFLGEVFSGKVWTVADVAAQGDFEITISCRERQPSAGGRRRPAEIVWQGTALVDGATRSSAGVPFAIALEDAGAARPSDDAISWVLDVRAAAAGADFRAAFPLVVARRSPRG
jgi:hypothetical protein